MSSLIVGIDFGTTFTGFAYGRGPRLEDIKLNKPWINNTELHPIKTSTSILIKRNNEVEEFGIQAEFKYSKLCAQNDGEHVELYKHFKMLLYNSKDITVTTEIKSVRGVPRKAIEVFALALKAIKCKVYETISSDNGSFSPEPSIKWVLTIPAIWTDKAKFFMREAAFQGGLIPNFLSTQLVFALEPEAASLYIHAVKMDQFQRLGALGSTEEAVEFSPGTKYMVIDAGGGTIDITAHEVVDENQVKELIPASGGDWGGYYINLNFFKWVETTFGTEFIKAYKEQSPHKWMEEFEVLFEKKKRANSPESQFGLNIPISSYFEKQYERLTKKSFEDVTNQHQGSSTTFSEGTINFEIAGILDLYHKNLGHITEHLEEVLSKPQLKDLKYIFLVGGFSEDAFFNKAISGLFHSRVVLVPNFSSTAVMKGAVLFGYKLDAIKSRKARRSYGYSVLQPFVKGMHDESKLTLDEYQKEYCDKIFKKIVTSGEEVQNNEERTFESTAFLSTGISFPIKLFGTEKRDVMYVDEPHVELICQANLKMEDTTGGQSRKIGVKVLCGGTELLIEAYDPREGGEKVEMTIDFLSS